MILFAMKNVFRNRRRTAISLFLVISGTFLLSAMRFFAYGIQQDAISQAIRLDSGFLEVAGYGWKERASLYRVLEVEKGFLERVSVAGVNAISPRIRSGALLSYKDKTRFISVLAADPAREKEITTLHSTVKEGALPVSTGKVHGAMMGYRMARSLGIKIGETFYLVSSQVDGSMGAIAVQLSGIYRANQSHLDTSRVVLSLEAGEELFGTRIEDRIYYTSLALGVKDYRAADRVKKTLLNLFPPPVPPAGVRPENSEIYDPVVLDWKELNPGVMEMLDLTQMKMDVYLFFFAVSISFGVLNTVQMSIQERVKEFGVLIAIGTGKRRMMSLISWEIFFLIVPGVLAGIFLAAGVSAYFHYNPIDISGTTIGDLYEGMGIMARLRPIIGLGEFWKTSLALIIPAFMMGLFAARRVLKLDPSRAINII